MARIVQINITASQCSSLAGRAAAALAEAPATVLEARAACVFGEHTLGLVVHFEQGDERVWVAVLQAAEPAAHIRTRELTPAAYAALMAEQAAPRHVLTVLSRRISAGQLAKAVAIVEAHGLHVEGVQRLSAPAPLQGGANACFELTLAGHIENTEALRAELLAAASELEMDLALQADDLPRRHRRLAVFDMDSTLIQAEVIDELAKAAGVGERVSEITERAMRGELDFRASFTERLALLKGLDVSVLDAIGASLRLTEGAEQLFAGLHRLGYKTAILSGGFTYFARQIQARLGIDYVFANELEVVDGKCTGVAVEPIVDAQRKADLLRELAAKEGVSLEQTVAVGDGANDLPMLALAGLGVAFRAKPLVRQSAQQAITTVGLDGVLYLLGVKEDAGASNVTPNTHTH